MSRFVNDAMSLLEAAETARAGGHATSEMAILISPGGGIRMVSGSDWPLESLQAHHGARTAYRISSAQDKILVEGREAGRTCRVESEDSRQTARLLLGTTNNYAAVMLAL